MPKKVSFFSNPFQDSIQIGLFISSYLKKIESKSFFLYMHAVRSFEGSSVDTDSDIRIYIYFY